MHRKVLIANRGEIACRIMATCRRLGVRTVAVYSDADIAALHVRLADEAIRIGPAPARDSYLQFERILEAARAAGADAIHPGYGFLSENAEFAAACATAGVAFIGPSVEAIRAMGSKSAAKQLMHAAGVPLVPGYHGDRQDAATLQSEAERIGFPVLIKASAGGGGKGMRVVQAASEFAAALASCQREALASFADERVLIEKYLVRPRHIEIQVFGDAAGNIVSLFDRDCSAQRRHQKVIEEAPASGLSPQDRAAMAQAARAAAAAVGYVGAGTVEFIVDAQGAFYFMEMNTRLQVEHPVTEMITGLDLVEWQLRVAAGEALPLRQEQLLSRGHAVEVRIYAEEPERGFLPSIGRLAHLALPERSEHVRIDTGIEAGDSVTPYYDPMIAKLITWDETRAGAIERMLGALDRVQVAGVGCNVRFLRQLVADPVFRDCRIDTGFIERAGELLWREPALPRAAVWAAALWVLEREREQLDSRAATTMDAHSPWHQASGWRLNAVHERLLRFTQGETRHEVRVRYVGRGYEFDTHAIAAMRVVGSKVEFEAGGRREQAAVAAVGEQLHVFLAGHHAVLAPEDVLQHAGEHAEHQGGLVAPMPGTVIALCVVAGAEVRKGDALLVLEAMKMEHTLQAPSAGIVRSFHCVVGAQVKDGVELIEFEPRA